MANSSCISFQLLTGPRLGFPSAFLKQGRRGSPASCAPWPVLFLYFVGEETETGNGWLLVQGPPPGSSRADWKYVVQGGGQASCSPRVLLRPWHKFTERAVWGFFPWKQAENGDISSARSQHT